MLKLITQPCELQDNMGSAVTDPVYSTVASEVMALT